MENIEALQAIERGEKPDQDTLHRLNQAHLIDITDVTDLQSRGPEFIFVGFTPEGFRVLKQSKGPLISDTEREIILTVVRGFLDEHRATSSRELLRTFKSPVSALLQRLDPPILRMAHNIHPNESYLPRANAFYHCGDSAALAFARKSTVLVLRVLRDLFDEELKGEGNDQRLFSPGEVETAARAIDSSVESNMIFVGLYLAQEFSVFPSLRLDAQQVGIVSFSLGERIYETRYLDWDDHIRRSNIAVTMWAQNHKESLEDDLPSLGNKHGLKKASKMAKTGRVFETAFETYTAVQQVGSGGSGVVFLVKTPEEQELALKVLDCSKTPREKVKRFQNEIQFCQRQASDRIVRVLDYGQAPDGSIFYLMPYYAKTLRDLIKKQLPMNERLPLYVQVLDSVEAAHLLGVCHRDIKPENLLYDAGTNRIVLADFGIARFQEDELLTVIVTGRNERLANFAYAAPEQRKAGKAVDQRADIYALGLILNEMFTGEIPQGTGFRQIRETASDFAYLDELVDMMVQQQPEQRIQSVAKVKQELIGRGNNFVSLQKLELLKKQVVPESEVSDPIIADPIRVVEKVDWNVIESTLTLRLNQPINAKWEQCFRFRATGFSTNFSHGNIRFSGDRVFIHVNEHFVPQGIQYLQQYVPTANEEYAAQVKQEHQREIAQRRAELERRVREQEARTKILQKVQI